MKTEFLLNREVDRVLALLTPSNRLVMRVCLHTGLRISDVLELRSAQLASRFWIRERKTGKKKLVGLPADLLADLKREAGHVFVFESRIDPQRHRTRQAVWADVKRASKAFRLPQNVAPHSFRKVYAVAMMDRYGNIDKVRRALNHRFDSTTLIYVMADAALTAKYRKKGKKA